MVGVNPIQDLSQLINLYKNGYNTVTIVGRSLNVVAESHSGHVRQASDEISQCYEENSVSSQFLTKMIYLYFLTQDGFSLKVE